MLPSQDSNQRPVNCKSDALPVAPPSHPKPVRRYYHRWHWCHTINLHWKSGRSFHCDYSHSFHLLLFIVAADLLCDKLRRFRAAVFVYFAVYCNVFVLSFCRSVIWSKCDTLICQASHAICRDCRFGFYLLIFVIVMCVVELLIGLHRIWFFQIWLGPDLGLQIWPGLEPNVLELEA